MPSSADGALIADRIWIRPTDRERAYLRTAVLVIGGALLTAALAQFEIRLSFTPVPITGQTLGVLLAGGALGSRLGAASQALYWMFGLVGLPFYSGGDGGWSAGTGASLGYFVGFIVAAAIVGYLVERSGSRNLASSLSAMALGSVVIYVFGAFWLASFLTIPLATGEPNALQLGVTPFLIGDLLKLTLAGALLPAASVLTDRS
jgi:biotin transport system substrate-specific component